MAKTILHSFLRHAVLYTVPENAPTVKRLGLTIIRIDFDDIWQKYSKYSRIEFVCFSFHVGLLVITLSSLKLHTEHNVCYQNLIKLFK